MSLHGDKLKKFNIDLIRSTLRSENYMTVNDLSDATGLDAFLCEAIARELCGNGEVLEEERNITPGAEGEKGFILNSGYAHMALIIARVEKSGKSICSSIVNLSGHSVYKETLEYDDISTEQIVRTIERLREKCDTLRLVSIAIPGIVHDGYIRSCELDRLSRTGMREFLEKKFVMPVILENDVNSTALGYYDSLKSSNPESLVYMYYSEEGLSGAGIVVNGRVLKGKSHFAGEISFLPLGVKTEKQGILQKRKGRFAKLVADTVLSVNCLINPECIVIAGRFFNDELKENIGYKVQMRSPEGQNPLIIFEQDIEENCLRGLSCAAFRLYSKENDNFLS